MPGPRVGAPRMWTAWNSHTPLVGKALWKTVKAVLWIESRLPKRCVKSLPPVPARNRVFADIAKLI